MNIFKSIYGALTGQVQIKDITRVRVLGTVYPLVMSTTSGSSNNYKTTYTIARSHMEVESARDWEEYIEVEERDVEEFISEMIWVPKDSLAGILSKVTFDEKHLKLWKQK